jgi:hypothetical protein
MRGRASGYLDAGADFQPSAVREDMVTARTGRVRRGKGKGSSAALMSTEIRERYEHPRLTLYILCVERR